MPERQIDFTRRMVLTHAQGKEIASASDEFLTWFVMIEGAPAPGECDFPDVFGVYVRRCVLAWRAWQAGRFSV